MTKKEKYKIKYTMDNDRSHHVSTLNSIYLNKESAQLRLSELSRDHNTITFWLEKIQKIYVPIEV